jgi:hypothetical protein
VIRKVLLFYLIAFGCCCACANDLESVWKQVEYNSFINSETVIREADDNIYIFLLKSYNKGQYEPVNGVDVDYAISQYTVDCNQGLYKIGMIDSYSKEGNFVNGDYNRFAKFQPVVSGIAVYNVMKDLCKQ